MDEMNTISEKKERKLSSIEIVSICLMIFSTLFMIFSLITFNNLKDDPVNDTVISDTN